MMDGATDTEVFNIYVREVLAPTLRPGDLVVMDNLAPHQSREVRDLIADAGEQIAFLPAYSPDLNPIEKMSSKVRESLRAAEARTQQALIQAVPTALSSVTAQE